VTAGALDSSYVRNAVTPPGRFWPGKRDAAVDSGRWLQLMGPVADGATVGVADVGDVGLPALVW
jgi:hypothetical protein